MAVEKMYLVNMVSDLKNLDSFLEDVIKIGDIEPVDAFNQLTNRTFSITASAENIDITEDINKLAGFSREDDGYKQKLSDLKNSLDLGDGGQGELIKKERLDEYYSKLKDLIRAKEDLEDQVRLLSIYQENIDLLSAHDIDIEKVKDLKYFDYRFGSITEDGRFILKNNYENIPSLILHLDNDVDMESIKAIDEIANLDQATENLVEKTENILRQEMENTQNISLSLDRQHKYLAKEKSDDIYEQIMGQSAEKIKAISDLYQARIENMDTIYRKYKDEIIDNIVDYLIYDKEES